MLIQIWFNPVLFSVTVLLALCFLRVNVLLSLIMAALSAGLVGKMSIGEAMHSFVQGMGANTEMALGYVLLGTFAASMTQTGLTRTLTKHLVDKLQNRKFWLFIVLISMAIASQNVVPVHVAFIPILIPPLLPLLNRMRIDRRMVACMLTFGLVTPYIAIPAGFGLIFQRIVADSLTQNGMELAGVQVWQYAWILGVGMIFGLCVAMWHYRRPRTYKESTVLASDDLSGTSETKWTKAHYVTLLAAVVMFGIQVITGSLPLGALGGLGIVFSLNTDSRYQMDELLNEGCCMMSYVAFVILSASGFAAVLKASGGVEQLVSGCITFLPGTQFAIALLILGLGLLITIGTGSSFGAIPILAAIFVPIFQKFNFSPGQAIVILASAGALGDAGSPASDSSLGPSVGLNVDGQHDHLYDTCLPTFLSFNVALFISALMGVVLFK